MIKTFFYLKTDKSNSKGESPIYAKIQLHGKTSTLSTGKYILKERWDLTDKLKKILRLEKEKNLKRYLDNIEIKIENSYLELVKKDVNTTLNDIKNKLNGISKEKVEIDILKLFKVHNDNFKRKSDSGERSKASLQKYNRAKDLITNFIKLKKGKISFNILDINNQFIYDLEAFFKV
jgi:hypothetical protein